jgi:hypothetical protein
MRKTIVLMSIVLFTALLVPIGVLAATQKTGASVYVSKDEIVPDNLYAAGNAVTIDGNVKGDLICAGASININGKIEGDVICAGQSININGEVTGSVRLIGSSINLNNKIGRNVNVAGGFVNFGSNANVGQDVIMGAGNGEVRGKINRDLIAAGGYLIIDNEIGGDARLWVDNNAKTGKQPLATKSSPLTITDKAKINGYLTYTSTENASVAQGATIKGEVKHNLPKQKEVDKRAFAAMYGWMKIVCLFAMLVVGLVLVSLWREEIKKITEVDKWQEKLSRSLGWGLVVLFLTPFIIIILLITMIGIPLALILGGLWLIALYVSKILAAILIGRAIIERWWHKKKDSLVIAMVLGVFVLWLLCFFPIIGFAFCFLATLWGLGTLWLFFKNA